MSGCWRQGRLFARKVTEVCGARVVDARARRGRIEQGNRMAIRYGCFFSYAHGRHSLMQHFKAALVDALQCYLEPYFDNEEELFVDTEQLGGGDDLDGRIARAMCESVCMILIY